MEIKPYSQDQKWDDLKLKYSKDSLFEDPHFPADISSLGTIPLGDIKITQVDWKRPQEFLLATLKPQFVVDGFSRFDLHQGKLGDCWFISGCVGILQEQSCFDIVVPKDQDYDDNYCGMFHFRFWLCGEWVDVVIDDRLPCVDNKLIFCSNNEQPNEMWGPLLEKAYAKFYGSYQALISGDIYDAFLDMNSGVQEIFNFKPDYRFYNTQISLPIECPDGEKNQDYFDILGKQKNKQQLFIDPYFTNDLDLVIENKNIKVDVAQIEWKRPKDFIASATLVPKFFLNAPRINDLNQSEFSSSSFLIEYFIKDQYLFDFVVPKDQDYENNYAGVFHFRFYSEGTWYDVVIDDQLPFIGNELIFHSNIEHPNEMWIPLLEKAYIKFLAKNPDGYSASDISDQFKKNYQEINEKWNSLWTVMYKGFSMNSVMGCNIRFVVDRNPNLSNGLIVQHAYAITCVKELEDQGYKIRLIRLRNPYGNSQEWNGDWGDHSSKWDRISNETKKELDFKQLPDGEFWMCFEDFVANFEQLQVCHLNIKTMQDELLHNCDLKHFWCCESHKSEWRKGVNAGGFDINQELFWNNPQFIIRIKNKNDSNSVYIDLLQEVKSSASNPKELQKIQFSVFKLKDDVEVDSDLNKPVKFSKEQVDLNSRETHDPNVRKRRQLCKGFSLKPGNYVVIPAIMNDTDWRFLLRIYKKDLLPSHLANEIRRTFALNKNKMEANPS